MANTFPMAFSVMALNTARMGRMKYNYAVILLYMLFISSLLSPDQNCGAPAGKNPLDF